jgi:hypothetical protein
MSEWTEYHPGLEWPEGKRVDWQYMDDNGNWIDTKKARLWWDCGRRIRYRIHKVKTPANMANQYAVNYGGASNPPNSVTSAAYFGFMNGWKAARENPEVEW